ncbi:MAG: diaminopimelate decarboxylase, partial [Defluviitaleaceae bacterium]|nr:diaminopimelate decarboxylase [Defluviitaleaceae bacterium]
LLAAYGSPLFVYSERVLRERCREMRGLTDYKRLQIYYSAKANTNVRLLEIIRDEGLNTDAMSPGEILAVKRAGFTPERILYVSNNVTAEELRFALKHNLTVCVDSLSQLELFGRVNPGGNVAIRINPNVGAGHHEKVVTGGKDTKFGVNMEYEPQIREILNRYSLRIIGLHAHIGSLFMDETPYMEAAKAVMGFAKRFDDLDFVDFGGGFGVPYRKLSGELRFCFKDLSVKLNALINEFTREYGKEIVIKLEPGRYIVAECGVLLGTVTAVKYNAGNCFAGTDIGFNILPRPVMYGAHHDIELYRPYGAATKTMPVTVVGNICESGDIIARDMQLPEPREGDVAAILDTGAYCFVMASNYNQRPLPAEVLITMDGSVKLIRRAQTPEELLSYLD